jgi:hypothetical protein
MQNHRREFQSSGLSTEYRRRFCVNRDDYRIDGRGSGQAHASDVARELESLPRNKEHCAVLAIDALRSALIGQS